MKAIQYEAHGGPEVLKHVELPDPVPSEGEVLVRIRAASLNHIDVHRRRGLPGMHLSLPHVPGGDGAGEIEALGPHVSGITPGDRVYLNPGYSCGTCDRCRDGKKSLCHKYAVLGEHTNGTYAEKILVPAAQVVPLPKHVSFETAAAAPVTYLTAWNMVVTKGEISPGMTVLVMGASSGVSAAAIQIAKLAGATVFTTAGTEEKAKRARELFSVDEVILYTQCNLDEEVRKLTGKKGVDLVIDHVGGEQWVKILRSTRKGGTIVTCGATAGFDPKEDLRQIFFRQLRILGSTMGNDAELMHVMNLIFTGKLSPIIDKTYPLSEAADAHRRMEARQSFGKIVLIP